MKKYLFFLLLIGAVSCKKDSVALGGASSEDCRLSISFEETIMEFVIPGKLADLDRLTDAERAFSIPKITKQSVDLCLNAYGTVNGEILLDPEYNSPIPKNALGQRTGLDNQNTIVRYVINDGNVSQYNVNGNLLGTSVIPVQDLTPYEELYTNQSLRTLTTSEASTIWGAVINAGIQSDSISPAVRVVSFNTSSGLVKKWYDIQRWIELQEILYHPDGTANIGHFYSYSTPEDELEIPTLLGRKTIIPTVFNMSEEPAAIVIDRKFNNLSVSSPDDL